MEMNFVSSKFQIAPLYMRGLSLITTHSVPTFGPLTKDKGNPLCLHLGFKNAYPVFNLGFWKFAWAKLSRGKFPFVLLGFFF